MNKIYDYRKRKFNASFPYLIWLCFVSFVLNWMSSFLHQNLLLNSRWIYWIAYLTVNVWSENTMSCVSDCNNLCHSMPPRAIGVISFPLLAGAIKIKKKMKSKINSNKTIILTTYLNFHTINNGPAPDKQRNRWNNVRCHWLDLDQLEEGTKSSHRAVRYWMVL